MTITATLINLYHVCKRETWLHANCIRFEHTSDTVYEGKLIHETSYPQRSEKYQEIEIDGIKIDFFDQKNKVIHEIKKSDKIEEAHEWQVKFYIYTLEKIGVEGVTGILEYPKLRKTSQVSLNDEDRRRLMEDTKKIEELIESDKCPPAIKSKICKSCSYYEFCYCKEEDVP